MKKAIIGLIIFMSSALFSQSADTYLELLRSDIKTQKKAVVAQSMELNDLEAEKFWPIYRDFEYEGTKLGDVWVDIIKEYAANYENMTDEKADELMLKSFDFNEGKVDRNRKYYKKVKEALGAKKAGKFIQIINRVNMLIDLQTATEIPLLPVDSDSTGSM